MEYESLFKTSTNNTRQNTGEEIEKYKCKKKFTRYRFSHRAAFYWNFLPLKTRKLSIPKFKVEVKKAILKNKQAFLNFGLKFNIVSWCCQTEIRAGPSRPQPVNNGEASLLAYLLKAERYRKVQEKRIKEEWVEKERAECEQIIAHKATVKKWRNPLVADTATEAPVSTVTDEDEVVEVLSENSDPESGSGNESDK